ncbi:MAG: N4-gp56 family major capsid protein [Candidatus Hodarchaeota archaeon]
MELTTTTQVDPAVATFYDRVLLKRALPKLVHDKFAQIRNIPKKSGNTIKFRRYGALTVATTPLTEGQTPPGQKLSKSDLTAQISQYGDYVHISDWVDLTVEDAVLTEAAELLGEQLGKTRDTLIRDILCACASSTDCTGGSNGKTPTEYSKTAIDGIVKILLGADTDMISNIIVGSTKVGTVPIRDAFFGIAHTDLVDALEAVSGFKYLSEYAQQGPIMEAEWGATGNVRWLISTNGHKDTSTTPDTYKSLIIGKNAYGITNLEAGGAKNIVKAFGSGGTADPLNQRCTSGWKMAFVARILNDNFMHILKCSNKAGSG